LLIRSDLIRNRENFYSESNIHADKEACFDILQESDFGFVHQILTYTRRHNETTTTFIRKYETNRIGHLLILKKYGPIFLTPEEYKQSFKRKLDAYHKFLARKIFERKDKAYWDFHRKALEQLGHPLSVPKLVKAMLLQCLDLRETTGIIRSSIRQKEEHQMVSDSKRWNIVGT
jgi:hypothetical protein